MNEATAKALEAQEVFSKEYVHQLREEAKANRLKTDDAVKKTEDVQKKLDERIAGQGNERVNAAIELERKDAKKNLAILEIKHLCKNANVEIDPEQVYQDGVEAVTAFNEYAKKNAALFKKTPLNVRGVDLGAGESTKVLLEGSMKETRENPEARGMLSRIYRNLIDEDRQKNRMRR